MLAFSAGFISAGYIFLRLLNLGAEGLVWANTLNMAFRIIWSTAFIKAYLKRHGFCLDNAAIIPRPMTIAAVVGTAAVLRQMESTFTGDISDILRSGVVAVIFVLIM
jgi:oligosaccharide translocation protein RFT1